MKISVAIAATAALGVTLGATPAHADPSSPPSSGRSAPAAGRAPVKATAAVEELLRSSQDPLRRETAALVLGVRGSAASLPLLREALAKDKNKWVRARAAEALGLIGNPAAIPWLHSVLSSEKEPRIRRTVAEALLRLGQNASIKELVWQLTSGNNYTKAEAMIFLAAATGQPLGQDSEAWWDYFNERGGALALARRPTGSPAVMALGGVAPDGPAAVPAGPFLHTRRRFVWRQVPAVVLDLSPRREVVDRAALTAYEAQRGRIPDGCLLLIRTDWRHARPRLAPRAQPPSKVGDTTAPRPMARVATELAVPWLDPEAVAFLLKRAPKLIGVGLDAPSLEVAPATARPARDALLAADRLALESLGDLDRLVASGTRLILLPQAAGAAATVLALLP